MSTNIAITSASDPMLECIPSLMPFHIKYNGPALVSAFMHVEKLVDNVEAEAHEPEPQTVKLSEDAEKSPVMASQLLVETPCLQATTSSDTIDDPPTLTRSTTESTLVTESSSITLEGSTSDLTVSSSSQIRAKSQDLAPPIEELDKRFISTFRGRSIHGLTIDLPDGYAGVVLKSTSDRLDEGVSGTGTGRRNAQRKMDDDVDVEMESQRPRRRGRLRSSAAPRKGTVITIPDEDNAPQSSISLQPLEDNDIEMAESFSTLPELDAPLRTLVPTARFDSFTLWQADRVVNKSNDEYWRTLTEWIALAHEIHNVDV